MIHYNPRPYSATTEMTETPIILSGSNQEKAHFRQLFQSLSENDLAKDEAVALPNTKQPGYSPIYRNRYIVEHNNNRLIDLIDPKLNTAFNFWKCAVNLWPNSNCIGERQYLPDKDTGKLHLDNFYTFQTYKQVDARKSAIGSGIIELVTSHVKYRVPKLDDVYTYTGDSKQDCTKFVVSILSSNRPEWVITDLACQAYSLCSTTLYDNLGQDTAKYILALMKSPIIFTTKDKVLNILSLKKQYPKELENLLIIITFDLLDFKDDYFFYKFAHAVGIDLYDFRNLEKLGKLNAREFIPPVPSTPYTVCFTSGTTGVSKGVYLTHGNMATSLTFCFHHWPRPTKENSIIGNSALQETTDSNQLKSYCLLPLAHIYERQTTTYSLVSNIAVGFPSGNISTRVEDCSILKPNYIQAVPRIYTRIEQELKALVSSNTFLQQFITTKFKLLFNNLIKDPSRHFKFKTIEEELEFKHFDLIVTQRLRELQGFHHVKMCLSASAPISLTSQNFICTVLNVGFVQNYGASEVTSACTGEFAFRLRITKEMLTDTFSQEQNKGNGNGKSNGKQKSIVSCSGPIGVTTDIKLKDLPELGYVYNSPDGKPKGEVLFRGPQVFGKYVYQPEVTASSFEDHGDGDVNGHYRSNGHTNANDKWYRTGDICELGPDGKMYVIDRIKNFFKLSVGEYLTPERIENIYLSNVPFVNQCFVHGWSDKDFIVGVVGLIPDQLKQFFQDIVSKSDYDNDYNGIELKRNLGSAIQLIYEFEKSITAKQQEQAQEIELTEKQAKLITSLLTIINGASNTSANSNIKADTSIKKLLIKEMNNLVAKNPNVSLAKYEKLNNAYFGYFPLTIKQGMLTPTLKLQRPTTIKNYRAVLEKLYDDEGSLIGRKAGEAKL